MLGENIRTLRRQKGYSQEALAEKLHVVRQTVSKWEKGLSVPDAALLQTLAELFEVPVSSLLGEALAPQDLTPQDEIAAQLALLNDQILGQSRRRKRLVRRCCLGAAAVLLVLAAVYVFCFWRFRVVPRQNAVLTTTQVECQLDGETYLYSVTYDENYQIIYAGGDAWIANHVQTEQYSDANILLAQIEDYFALRGGSCTITQ